MDVGKNSTACDGNTSEQLVQLLIVLDGKGDVTRDDTSLLVITGGIACKLEDLSAEVLKDGGKVDGCTGSHAGGVLSLTEEAANTADGELQSSLGRRAGGLLFAAASFSFSYCYHRMRFGVARGRKKNANDDDGTIHGK